jgi:hypothetical protein
MKYFYLKIITFLVIVITLYLSIESYHSYTQTKNFQILNQKHSIIVQLPNNEYMEIIARNDNITNRKDYYVRPFSTNTKIQKNTDLENSIAKIGSHTEYLENGIDYTRLLTLTPLNSKNISVDIYSETKYSYQENLFYSIQIDYTNQIDSTVEGNKLSFRDKGCMVTVIGKDLSYSKSDNSKSLILSKRYEPKLNIRFDLVIDCSNK